jgi:hypothetical protein
MTDTTTTTQPAKRGRNGSVILTDRMCEKRVAKRDKIYDRKCPGLYVSITTAGVATFSFKFTDPATGKQRTGWLGVYNPETFTVEHARSKVYAAKAMDPAALVEQLHQRKVQKAKHGVTVAKMIEERIDWMKTLEKKKDGEMRPRIESWSNVASHLRRFVKPKLGHMDPRDVTRQHIAELSNDILEGKFGVPSASNARHEARRLGPVHLGGRGWSGLHFRNLSALLQPSEAADGACARARAHRGRDQDFLAWPRPRRPAVGSPDPVGAQVRADHHAAVERAAGRAR